MKPKFNNSSDRRDADILATHGKILILKSSDKILVTRRMGNSEKGFKP